MGGSGAKRGAVVGLGGVLRVGYGVARGGVVWHVGGGSPWSWRGVGGWYVRVALGGSYRLGL